MCNIGMHEHQHSSSCQTSKRWIWWLTSCEWTLQKEWHLCATTSRYESKSHAEGQLLVKAECESIYRQTG